MRFTVSDFLKKFPDDNACIDHLFQRKYTDSCCPKCEKKTKFYRVKRRKSFECGTCGYQVYPMSGTIMEGSTTPARLWYYAIYLFSQSKNGVSAKELERQLGVTYKTAFRMGHRIRESMARQSVELVGVVHIDESLYGPRGKNNKRGWAAEKKVCLFGMIEKGGNVKVVVVKDRKNETLIPIIEKYVSKDSEALHTDKFGVYKKLPGRGFKHKIKDNTTVSTNCIEGYWGNFKKSIAGTHTWVTEGYLQNYLTEFEFRHNNRKGDIFDEIIKSI